ncbi:hypothetical protein T484DRAFT_2951735 [Baffinella frigidus]|nr:hypothetical protein T484DRAFT_2951735 [Cryptophyta sp. CCMP2293]
MLGVESLRSRAEHIAGDGGEASLSLGETSVLSSQLPLRAGADPVGSLAVFEGLRGMLGFESPRRHVQHIAGDGGHGGASLSLSEASILPGQLPLRAGEDSEAAGRACERAAPRVTSVVVMGIQLARRRLGGGGVHLRPARLRGGGDGAMRARLQRPERPALYRVQGGGARGVSGACDIRPAG